MSRPFDSAKYEALLEELEISVLPLSEVRRENRVFRYDAQYFSKSALAAEARIRHGKWAELQNLATEIKSFGAYALTNLFSYVEEGIPFLRCLNIRDGLTDFTDVLYITPEANALLTKSEVRPGMVLLTMSGSVGNATVSLENWRYPINSNQDVAKITPTPNTSPYYLAAFLNSRYGQVQMERLPVGSVQQHIFLWMIERIVVARFRPNFEEAVSKIVKSAYEHDAASSIDTERATQILLRALGLERWQPPEPLAYTQRASNVFAARRLDAAYFSPRVKQLTEILGADHISIGNVAPARHEEFTVAGVCEFDYIEISDVHSDGTVATSRLHSAEAPSRATWYVHSGDVVTSTVRPIRRLSAIIAPEQDGFVCSSGFVVLEPRGVSSELLVTYLRLPPICELMDLHTSASMYPAISERDLLALPLRRVSETTEREIVATVNRARAARREARDLLNRAKRAVEIAIEESETAALSFLD